MKKNSQAQLQGMLLGLAIGDALGAPIEHGYTSDEIAGRIEELRHMPDEASTHCLSTSRIISRATSISVSRIAC